LIYRKTTLQTVKAIVKQGKQALILLVIWVKKSIF